MSGMLKRSLIMNRINKIILILIGIGAFSFWVYSVSGKLENLNANAEKKSDEINLLNEKVASLSQKLEIVAADKQIAQQETVRREIIHEKSQEELLTAAVQKIASSVVSIVITKDVPKLEVVYVNPFGSDPFFKDSGIRIPQYQQKGFETQKVGAGTGFIVGRFGYILTNRHVARDTQAHYTILLSNGSQQEAQVVYRDEKNDIALLKISGEYKPVEFGDSDSLKLGQSVFAVGNALGEYSNSVSVGVISGLNRNIEASNGNQVERLENVIQTDAAINSGNSGGPLVDLNGKVVGINVATVIGSQSIGFSIPVNAVKNIIQAKTQ